MKENEALQWITQASKYGIVPGLDSVRELCARLGNPQKDLKFIHIAGTNGKGSTSAFISSALKQGGYRVGRYISPVIFEYRERIQVDDKMITRKALAELTGLIKEACEDLVAAGLPHPTPFEIETVMGFLYFKEKKCDLVVMETGMGGRLDATNIVGNTLVAVLTSISMDHMQYLGDSLEKIAIQKAGIIKPGCSVVSAKQQPKVMEVIRKEMQNQNQTSPQDYERFLRIADPVEIKNAKYGLEKQFFDYGKHKKIEISLAGKYQLENALLAWKVLEALAEQGYPVKEEKIRKGFATAKWPGRFSVVAKNPLFIVDGAHNEDAAKRLAESIEFYFTNKRIIYIMGVLGDKEYEKVIAHTHKYAEHILTVTPPENARALPAYDLAAAITKVHPSVTAVDSLEEAVEISGLLADKQTVIIAFGSLSFLGRLMNIKASAVGKEAKRNDKSRKN